jgi:uncharacterized protein
VNLPACLGRILTSLEPFVVALSGGTDSMVLLAAAASEGIDVAAVSVETGLCPAGEIATAKKYAEALGVSFEIIPIEMLEISAVRMNTPARCYLCKRRMMEEVERWAEAHGYAAVVDGTNADDDPEDRPGMRVLGELGVVSPFRICGMGKAEIAELAEDLGIPVAPSTSCLATRFPPGRRITEEEVERVRRAEALLRNAGVEGRLRVRYDGERAVVEAERSQHALISALIERLRELGFSMVEVQTP